MITLLRSTTFWTGVAGGLMLLLLARLAINESTLPDQIVAPLLVQDSSATADAIVALGASTVGDCAPNLNAIRRIIRAARLYREGRAPVVVITGGIAGGSCPVADAMTALARDLGVPADRLVVERESQNTYQNGERTAPLLRARSIHRILLVTDRLHMRRAAGVFARLGFAVEPSSVPIYEGHPDNVSMLAAGVREAAALGYYRFRNWAADLDEGMKSPVTAEYEGEGTTSGEPVDRVSLRATGGESLGPIVILGASYAANWKIPNIGVPVVNAGVAGQQTSEMLARFDRDVVAVKPRAVLLWGFINDIFRTDTPEQATPGIHANYTEMIRRARARGIEPILATEVTVRPPKALIDTAMHLVGWVLGKVSYQDRVNQHVVHVNDGLRRLAASEGLLLLDFEKVLADSSGQRRWGFATDDGSHISTKGYEALNHYAEPLLSRRLAAASGPELP